MMKGSKYDKKRPRTDSLLPTTRTVMGESYRTTANALSFDDSPSPNLRSSMSSKHVLKSKRGSCSLVSLIKAASSVLFTLWLLLSCVTLMYSGWLDSGPSLNLIKSQPSLSQHAASSDQPSSQQLSQSSERPILKFHLPDVPSVPQVFSPSKQIPLPLPANKVSVVIMNHSRPRMLRESSLMLTLLSHPSVDEVLLLHSNPNTAFEYVHPKVINIDASQHNDQIGLSLRFYFCQLASNPWVIHVDDDMEFTSTTLSELIIEFAKNTHRIVGRFGRDLKLNNMFNGYSSKSTHKNTEVVLTKFMVMERQICPSFFELSHLIWDDTVLAHGEGPLWNGEDIFMSLVANHVYGASSSSTSSSSTAATDDNDDSDNNMYNDSNNYAMDWLDVWNAPDYLKDYDAGKFDISGGMTGYRIWDWKWWQSLLRRNRHYSYRGLLWTTAKSRLHELDGSSSSSSL